MLFNTLPDYYKKSVTELCELLHNRAYQQAENCLLHLIEGLLLLVVKTGSSRSDQVVTVIMIYTQFNIIYSDWLRTKGIDWSTELRSLDTGEHSNYLIAHCSDPASMDDLLWELSNYLEDPTQRNKEEVLYQLTYYKKGMLL